MMDNLTMNTLYFGMTANEILSLSAKVKAADGLVEALEALVDNFKIMENGFNKTLFDKARKALATYEKLSEVKQ